MVSNENSISVNGSAGHETGRVSGKRMSASSSQADRESELLLEIRARDEQIDLLVEEHRNALAKMGKTGMHRHALSTGLHRGQHLCCPFSGQVRDPYAYTYRIQKQK